MLYSISYNINIANGSLRLPRRARFARLGGGLASLASACCKTQITLNLYCKHNTNSMETFGFHKHRNAMQHNCTTNASLEAGRESNANKYEQNTKYTHANQMQT